MLPRTVLCPRPLAKIRIKPAVAPSAVDENWSSPISIVQVPRPTGKPANVTLYRASSLLCALT
jgi:hypothetical protein